MSRDADRRSAAPAGATSEGPAPRSAAPAGATSEGPAPRPGAPPRRVPRRQWLAALAPAAADLALAAVEARRAPPPEPQRRPPGALPEAAFLDACTRCHECVKACPHDAVHYFADSAGAPLAGTPVMRPDVSPCHLCEGYPCAAACPEPALTVPEKPLWSLGRVRLDTATCLAYQGPECGACIGLCPGGADALRLSRARPVLDAERCVGCGLCIDACVTTPRALQLAPLE